MLPRSLMYGEESGVWPYVELRILDQYDVVFLYFYYFNPPQNGSLGIIKYCILGNNKGMFIENIYIDYILF